MILKFIFVLSVLHSFFLLNNTQLYMSTLFSPFISWWTFGLFLLFGCYEITLLCTFVYEAFYGCMFSVFLVTHSVELLDHMVTFSFFKKYFEGFPNCFQRACTILHSQQQCARFQFLHIIDNTCYCLTNCSHPSGCVISLWFWCAFS